MKFKMRVLYSGLFVFFAGMASGQEKNLYWGDTHLHTSYSVDAFSNGNFTADPDTAYRFAKGLPVLHPVTGQRTRIERPLDFLVVADHSEMLQMQVRLESGDPDLLSTPSGERLAAAMKDNRRAGFGEVVQIGYGGGEEVLRDFNVPHIRNSAWFKQVDIAEQHNEPGKFTSLIGWEWSSAPEYANLHRVIFTPADAETAKKFMPINYYDTNRPEGLWEWLQKTSEETGADFVAIPHNSNMSDGKMFDMIDSDGRPLSEQYARTRMRWEPVMEITQVKGNSEVHPQFSPDDEFADFEIRNMLLINQPAAISPNSYARTALMQGLEIEESTGVNPYKFGFIGSTDSHIGLTSVEENNFFGKFANDGLPEQRVSRRGNFPAWEISASGLAGVWADENTRESISRAFKRKEVYSTTGPRISVRFFGGFNFSPENSEAGNIAEIGYSRGVPMGGDLSVAPSGESPSFLLQAVKDPIGANLDRVQIVKGWLDQTGQTHEKVFNVVWSDDREIDGVGKISAVGNTVDLDTASYTNTIGAAELTTVWQDPEFDREQRAFYYVRTLEIPTPRHQVYDAVALKMDPTEIGLPLVIQERAYSSPIWYTP